ncbi:hypothetical protein FRC10_004141 [Ceratobasidium sp. 414]|nr:hypothetical protein FRC10_004141 [Ceratobasidium sp. 414]
MTAFTLLNHTDTTVDSLQDLGDAPLSAGEAAWPPQDPNISAPITAAANPVSPDSGFLVDIFPFYIDLLAQFYLIQDNQDTTQHHRFFDINDPVWASLNISADPVPTLGHDNLPMETLLIAPGDASLIPDFNFGEMLEMFNPAVVEPRDFAPFGLSPNTSESCTSEWTSESTSPPLFSTPGSRLLISDFTALDVPSPPPIPPPPSSGAIKTKADVDDYVERLVTRRRRRDAAPKLKCPFEGCDPERTHRRPVELKEHMYSHIDVIPYKCPRANCISTFTIKSNLTRHRKTCRSPAE